MSVAAFAVARLAARARRWEFEVAGRRGARLGRIAYRLDRRHREVALKNLALAFPTQTDEWRQAVARASFEQAGRTVMELLWSPNLATAPDPEQFVTFEGTDVLRATLDHGKGAILASAHYGNWELTAIATALAGFPLVSIARPLDDARLDELLTRLRQSTGQRILTKRRALRRTLRTLREGNVVAVLTDQNTLPREAVFVPYFDRMAATTPAIAQLHVRTGAPIFTAFAVPDGGKYRVVIEPCPGLPESPTDDDVEAITAMITERIEHYVRAIPEAWLWMHDRWRARPEA